MLIEMPSSFLSGSGTSTGGGKISSGIMSAAASRIRDGDRYKNSKLILRFIVLFLLCTCAVFAHALIESDFKERITVAPSRWETAFIGLVVGIAGEVFACFVPLEKWMYAMMISALVPTHLALWSLIVAYNTLLSTKVSVAHTPCNSTQVAG